MNIFTNFVFNNLVNTIKSNENDLFANRFFDSFIKMNNNAIVCSLENLKSAFSNFFLMHQ